MGEEGLKVKIWGSLDIGIRGTWKATIDILPKSWRFDWEIPFQGTEREEKVIWQVEPVC